MTTTTVLNTIFGRVTSDAVTDREQGDVTERAVWNSLLFGEEQTRSLVQQLFLRGGPRSPRQVVLVAWMKALTLRTSANKSGTRCRRKSREAFASLRFLLSSDAMRAVFKFQFHTLKDLIACETPLCVSPRTCG
jgi:hypothetical protein